MATYTTIDDLAEQVRRPPGNSLLLCVSCDILHEPVGFSVVGVSRETKTRCTLDGTHPWCRGEEGVEKREIYKTYRYHD